MRNFTLPLSRGMFQVLLGEVNTGLNTTQVVVKELKSSASVQDQIHFLEEAQPYRYASPCTIKRRVGGWAGSKLRGLCPETLAL